MPGIRLRFAGPLSRSRSWLWLRVGYPRAAPPVSILSWRCVRNSVTSDSPSDARLQMRGVTIALHRYVGEGVLDFAQIVRGKIDIGRAEVFIQSIQLCCSRDWNNPRFSRKQPGNRDSR